MTWLLIVSGSRHGVPHLERGLMATCGRFGEPEAVFVREQTGVDQDTQAGVRANHLWLMPFAADMSKPSPKRYHEANEAMVNAAVAMAQKTGMTVRCAGFPCGRSKGTWSCMRCARSRGVECWVAWDGRMSRLDGVKR